MAAAETSEAGLRAAHQALLKNRELQFDFTTYVPPKPPGWLEALARLFEAIAPLLKWVFWAGLAAGAALILFFIAREVIQARLPGRRRRTAVAPVDWRPEPEKARALLEDADRLAAEGRFDEAAHLLLFRSIDDLVGRRPGVVRPALTSRDIAALDAMPPEPRSAFARIAQAVEASFFGGRRLDAAGFAEARGAYEAFAFTGAWT